MQEHTALGTRAPVLRVVRRIISLQYTINTYVHYQLVPGINYTQYIAYPPLLCHLLKPYVDTLHPAAEQFSNLCGTQMKTNRHAD